MDLFQLKKIDFTIPKIYCKIVLLWITGSDFAPHLAFFVAKGRRLVIDFICVVLWLWKFSGYRFYEHKKDQLLLYSSPVFVTGQGGPALVFPTFSAHFEQPLEFTSLRLSGFHSSPVRMWWNWQTEDATVHKIYYGLQIAINHMHTMLSQHVENLVRHTILKTRLL